MRRETADAVSVVFDVPPSLASVYAFQAGQYLTLRREIEGAERRRSYSICAGADEGVLRIAIKQVDGGLFSTWALAELKPGDVLDVMTPTGRFGPALPSGAGLLHVAIAAGSGITPIVSIAATVLAREPDSRFVLLYGSRSTETILFRAVLEDLKDRHLGRFSVVHVLSQEQQDLSVLSGRLDAERLDALLRGLTGGARIDHAYVCGPAGMIAAAERVLAALPAPPGRVHVERFTSALDGVPRAPAAPVAADAPPHAVAAVIHNGARRDVPVAEGEAILDAALRAGLDLPYACKGGMCCTCRARVTEGAATMEVNYSLERWEEEAGYVLTCQARPTTPHIVVDYDTA